MVMRTMLNGCSAVSDFNSGDSSIFYIVGAVKDDEGNFKFVAETEKSDNKCQ